MLRGFDSLGSILTKYIADSEVLNESMLAFAGSTAWGTRIVQPRSDSEYRLAGERDMGNHASRIRQPGSVRVESVSHDQTGFGRSAWECARLQIQTLFEPL
jgi:hypothetical protein